MGKNRFLQFWVACIFLVSLSTVAYATPFADFVLSDSYITVGEDFEVEVWGHADGRTDPPLLDEWLSFAFETTVTGSAFSLDGANVNPILIDNSIFFPPGYVSGSAFPGLTDEDILLATLQFSAIQTGSGVVSAFGDPLATDSIGTPLFAGMGFWNLTNFPPDSFFDIFVEIEITVNEVVIPEPATMLLFGLGLIGLAGIGRKKSLSL